MRMLEQKIFNQSTTAAHQSLQTECLKTTPYPYFLSCDSAAEQSVCACPISAGVPHAPAVRRLISRSELKLRHHWENSAYLYWTPFLLQAHHGVFTGWWQNSTKGHKAPFCTLAFCLQEFCYNITEPAEEQDDNGRCLSKCLDSRQGKLAPTRSLLSTWQYFTKIMENVYYLLISFFWNSLKYCIIVVV